MTRLSFGIQEQTTASAQKRALPSKGLASAGSEPTREAKGCFASLTILFTYTSIPAGISSESGARKERAGALLLSNVVHSIRPGYTSRDPLGSVFRRLTVAESLSQTDKRY